MDEVKTAYVRDLRYFCACGAEANFEVCSKDDVVEGRYCWIHARERRDALIEEERRK